MTVERISFLRGPDRVRKRPAVVFGSHEADGVQRAVLQLLNLFVTEAQLGHVKNMRIVHDGDQIDISADDQGLYLGQDTGDDRVWREIFCDFALASAYAPDENDYRYSLMRTGRQELYGEAAEPSIFLPQEVGAFDLCAIQYASAFMDVTVVRNGIKSILHFEKGYAQGDMICYPTEEPSGTSLHFAMDPEVFTHTQLPGQWFRETLQRYAILSPGLTCHYHNASDSLQETYCYSGGAIDYIHGKGAISTFQKRIVAQGKERYDRPEYEACVEVTVGYTPGRGEALCLHNFQEIMGGKHWEQLKNDVCCTFNQYFHRDAANEPLTFDELSRHLTVVLSTWCPPRHSLWANGTRTCIENQLIADMTHDALKNGFDDFVQGHAAAFSHVME